MEVKSVFMDLQEWVKKWNVWKLESEAFKKPIEIKIGYENKELQGIQAKFDWIEKDWQLHSDYITDLNKKLSAEADERIKLESKLKSNLNDMLDFNQSMWEQREEIKQLYKAIADLKTTIEVQQGVILHLQEKNKEIEKKLTKQPKVYHDKIFISWNEEVMLGVYDIPDWDYLCVTSIKIWEHNEFVTNQNELMIDKIHVEDWFTPRYQLYWGTELDTPTATVYYDLLLMPL